MEPTERRIGTAPAMAVDGIRGGWTTAAHCRRVHPQPCFRHHQREPKPTPTPRSVPVPVPPPGQVLRREAADADTAWSSVREQPLSTPADAMLVSPAAEEEDLVVGESCCDVDMGTPTAATNSLHSDWRDAASASRKCAEEANDQAEASHTRGGWRIPGGERGSSESSRTEAAQARPPGRMEVRASSGHFVDERPRMGGQEDSAEESTVEIQAFREYSHDDFDSFDVMPSQDFEGDARGDAANDDAASSNHGNTRPAMSESCAWLDYRDGTQFRDDEASEVFDNVIYAPPTLPPRASSASPPRATPPPNPLQPAVHYVDPDDLYESESELSDELEVICATFTDRMAPTKASSSPPPPTAATTAPSSATASQTSSVSGTPPRAPPHWYARMSVKRDCSFIDSTLTQRPKGMRVQDLSESGEEFEEKLKLIDGDDSGADSDDYCSSIKPRVASAATATSASAAVNAGLLLPGFRPKKKRRRVRQLALDAFLKVQPSATY